MVPSGRHRATISLRRSRMSASAAGASRSVRISRAGSPAGRAARPSSRRDGPSGAAGSRAEPADAASARADRHAAGRIASRSASGTPGSARASGLVASSTRLPSPRRRTTSTAASMASSSSWSTPPPHEGAARPRPERAAQAAIIASPSAAVNEMPTRSTLRVGEPLDEAGDDAVGGRAVVRQGEASDGRVDHGGLTRGQRRRERVLELRQAVDPVALRAAGLGVGDVVGVAELDQARLVEGRELEDLDQLELAVVEDHPNDGDIVLDGGQQLEARQQVAAVAAADDDRAVRVGHLEPKGAVDVPGHGAEAAGLAEILPVLELDIVGEPGRVRAGVGEQHAVLRQVARDRLRELARVDRAGDVEDVVVLVVLPLHLARGLAADLAGERLEQGLDGRLGVRHDGVGGLVALADLVRAEVDVDQRLAVEQALAEVEGRVLGEGVADRQHEVRLAEGLPGAVVAAVAEHADAQGVAFRDDALAVHRRGERDLEALDERADGAVRAAADRTGAGQQQDALARPEASARTLAASLTRAGSGRTGRTSRRMSR